MSGLLSQPSLHVVAPDHTVDVSSPSSVMCRRRVWTWLHQTVGLGWALYSAVAGDFDWRGCGPHLEVLRLSWGEGG